jgi:hypothetical protein
MLNFKMQTLAIIAASAMLAAMLYAVLTGGKIIKKPDKIIPDVTLTETIDGGEAKALRFGYSWYDGKNGVTADSIAAWQAEYGEENTLVIDGKMGQNSISLSVENPKTAKYMIYLPDGTVYDDGTREVYSSLGLRLHWTEDRTGISAMAPFQTGEYIYEVTVGWEKDDLEVTYGFKVIMTGEPSAFEDALKRLSIHYNHRLTRIMPKGTEILTGAEYAGECYVFEVMLPEGTQQAAVSKEEGILFVYDGENWQAFTGE